MQKKLMLAVAAVMMLAACNGSKTTHLSGEFSDNTADRVKVSVGDFDTSAKVMNGKFEIDVPKNLASMSRARAGMSVYSFISDGSKITLNPADGKAYSDKKKGVHSRYVEYQKWTQDFKAEYRRKVDEIGDDKAAADAYFNEMLAKYNDHLKATIKANKDNVLGVIALSEYGSDDPKVILPLIKSLSSKMQQHPDVVKLKKAYESK